MPDGRLSTSTQSAACSSAGIQVQARPSPGLEVFSRQAGQQQSAAFVFRGISLALTLKSSLGQARQRPRSCTACRRKELKDRAGPGPHLCQLLGVTLN